LRGEIGVTADKKKGGSDRGFAGLSSLVSDVGDVVNAAKQETARLHSASAESQSDSAKIPDTPSNELQQAATPATSGSSAKGWLLGIGAVVFVIWIFSTGSGNKSKPSNTWVAPSAPVAPARIESQRPSYAPARPSQAPSRPTEERPPIGTYHTLNQAQLRYCLAEKIRMDAAERILNNYIQLDVDRYNGMVSDFNSRCGQFRYRRGSLESARADVERFRVLLEAEGRSRFGR
jgi:hypothetical protein